MMCAGQYEVWDDNDIYFGVTDEQLNCVVVLRHDDSDELWAEVNRRRTLLGTGEVRGDL